MKVFLIIFTIGLLLAIQVLGDCVPVAWAWLEGIRQSDGQWNIVTKWSLRKRRRGPH